MIIQSHNHSIGPIISESRRPRHFRNNDSRQVRETVDAGAWQGWIFWSWLSAEKIELNLIHKQKSWAWIRVLWRFQHLANADFNSVPISSLWKYSPLALLLPKKMLKISNNVYQVLLVSVSSSILSNTSVHIQHHQDFLLRENYISSLPVKIWESAVSSKEFIVKWEFFFVVVTCVAWHENNEK